MSQVAYIVKESGISLFKDGKQYNAASDFWSFNMILERIKAQDFEGIENLFNAKSAVAEVVVDVEKQLNKESDFKFEIVNGIVHVNGKPFYNDVSKRIVSMVTAGFDAGPLINFIKRLIKNPSRTSVQELYPFMEKANVTVDNEGYIIAYKKVRADYLDIHSGTVDYHVGNIVEMPRNEVDDNRNNLCSDGLHFCSFSYLSQFGNDTCNRVLIVRVDPADVVSVPADHNDAKARACRIEVIGEIEEEMKRQDVLQKTPVVKHQELPAPTLSTNINNSRKIIFPYISDCDIGSFVNDLLAEKYKNEGKGAWTPLDFEYVMISTLSLDKYTLSTLTTVYNDLVSLYNVLQLSDRLSTIAKFKCSKDKAVEKIVHVANLIDELT